MRLILAIIFLFNLVLLVGGQIQTDVLQPQAKKECKVSVVDRAEQVEKIPIESEIKAPGPFPTGIAYDGKYLWVADRKTDLLYQINSEDGKIIKTIQAPAFTSWGLAWDGKYLWVSDVGESKIFQIDIKEDMVIKTIDAPSPSAVGLAWDGKNLIVADNREDMVHKISPDDGTSISSFKAPDKDSTGIVYDGKYLWISDRIKDSIYMVDYETGNIIFYFPSPGKYPIGLAFDGERLWNVDYQSKKIYSFKLPQEKFLLRNERYAKIIYTQEYHNYGPCDLKEAELYIAVPENRDNQKIIGEIKFEPSPSKYINDESNLRLAYFHKDFISPYEAFVVKMEVVAKIYEINYFIYPDKVGSLDEISKEIKDKYLKDGEKYNLNNEVIQKAVKEAVGNEKNPYWIARKIYNYLIEHLEYELAGGWNPAPVVLERGNGSCSEYTFVYIAMSRAAGLPARYVGSVVVRGDDASMDDVFHRWVEVYLPNYGWIPVDPSGGDNSLPSDQAAFFGHLSNRFLITTQNIGGSPYLGWTYNSDTKWKFSGKCKIVEEHYAEWEPIN